MTSRLKKVSYTTIVGLGLFAGAAGLTAAASGGSTPTPAPAVNQDNRAPNRADNPAEAEDANDSGINCENGIDTATGAECDGGPAAALADEATEAPEAEEAAEGADEADGVDHQFEGEETGNNGDGVPDANDANETP